MRTFREIVREKSNRGAAHRADEFRVYRNQQIVARSFRDQHRGTKFA